MIKSKDVYEQLETRYRYIVEEYSKPFVKLHDLHFTNNSGYYLMHEAELLREYKKV